MRRHLIGLLAALPLALAPAAAGAHSPGGGESGTGTLSGPVAGIVGTVVSVDATNGTLVANASVVSHLGDAGEHLTVSNLPGLGGLGAPGHHSGDSVTATSPPSQVTITVGPSTRLNLGGHSATLADLAPGDQFFALFSGAATDSLDTLVANPPLLVFAKVAPRPRELYAFVGTVTAVDTTAGTVSVAVTRSRPSDLLPPGSAPVTYTVGADTLILGGPSAGGLLGATLGDVTVGDVVAGGVIADSGLSLTDVQALPLRILLDLPAATGATGGGSQGGPRSAVLRRALSLLEGKSVTKHHAHKTSRRHHKKARGHKRLTHA
jgi:hypothetical protein